MHIAFLLPEYPHPKVSTHCGGIGTATHNIILGLIKQKHKVSVFVYGQNTTETFTEGCFTLYKIVKNKYKFGGWYFYRKHINNYLNTIISKEKIDILEAPDWGGITAFMSFKVPIVLRLHGSDAYFCHLEQRKQKQNNYFFEKRAFKKADAVIAVSNYVLTVTTKLFGKKSVFSVIPNGLFLDDFDISKPSKTTKNKVLYFGTLIRKKGVLELAYIFNELIKINPIAQLTIVGRDVKDHIENKSTLQLFESKLSIKARENFKYKGAVSYNKIREEIAKATVCVFPSLAESFGMVTIEAMVLKKGIVSTNYPWAQEIITDGETGLFEDPKKHKLYAQKINILLNDKALCVALGEKARDHVLNNFTMENLIDKNITFYKKIIGREI